MGTLSKEIGKTRSEGSSKRRQLTSRFIERLAADWEMHGDACLEQLRLEDNTTYCTLVAKLVPAQVAVEVEQVMPELEHLKTSEEVFAYIEGEIANLRAQRTLRQDYDERIAGTLAIADGKTPAPR
jgi:hypothetical protein